MAENDISRNTIFVLVALTLLISVLGTWTVLTQINAGPTPAPNMPQAASGHVQLTIINPNEKPQPVSTAATGRVVFDVKKK